MTRSKKTANSRFRKFHFEALEERQMRSVTPNDVAALNVPPDVASTTTVEPAATAATAAAGTSPSSSLLSPAQMRHIYGLDLVSNNGSGETIALIEAGHDARMQSNVDVFDQYYGLPALAIHIVPQSGRLPSYNAAWAAETAMDIEWAHAAAPGAKIDVFEANSSSFSDLMAAVGQARSDASVSVISMSFGEAEPVDEQVTYDSLFTTPANHIPITFIASSGDTGESPQYPATSPTVLSVGGTTLKLSNGNFSSETVWNDSWGSSSGGASHYEPKPAYQSGISLSNNRMVPDVAFDADPAANVGGINVFQTPGGGNSGYWTTGGGTSLGAPVWAGIIADANQGRAAVGRATLGNTVADVYSLNLYDFHDVSRGSNKDYSATPGYDMASGRGSPAAQYLIGDLVNVLELNRTVLPVPVGKTLGTVSTPSPTTGNASVSTSPALAIMPSDPAAVDQVFGASALHSQQVAAPLTAKPPFGFDTLMAASHDDGDADQMVDALFHGRVHSKLRG